MPEPSPPTIRHVDVGAYRAFTDVALRDAIASGQIEGPRMFVAGAYVTITGGGGEVTGTAPDVIVPAEMRRGVADNEAQVRQRMNEILKSYNAGIDVKLVQLQDVHPPAPVKDSFEEVNRAVQEMERAVNEALQERNKVLFRVEGEAKQRIAQAQGTQIERVNRARGDAARFTQLLTEYQKAPAVTRQRLYLEAMQARLPQTGRILVVDESVKGMLPVLNFDPSGKALPAPVAAVPVAPPEGGNQ